MSQIIVYSKREIQKRINYRDDETKLGEKMFFVENNENWIEEIKNHDSKFVVVGIAEDIGVRANFGRGGTSSAWQNFLDNFLNIQHNSFCNGAWFSLLGEINVEKEMKQAYFLNPQIAQDRKEMFEIIDEIDNEVQFVVEQIILSDKIPIIIGGGHNNAYGNIKGLSLAKNEPIGAVNFDAHSDFRPLEGRHSGNGFSYAMEECYLNRYFIFGLHENYLTNGSESIINFDHERVKFVTFEQINIRKEISFEAAMKIAEEHIGSKPFGLEIDLDSLPLVGSSAYTPSGFSVIKLRQFIHYFAKNINTSYLHICEGAPTFAAEKNPHAIGKLISYLVTDFAKSKINNLCNLHKRI